MENTMYQLIPHEHLRRLSDGMIIPPDPGNSDYQRYLEWLDDGNTPEPYTPVIGGVDDLIEAKKIAGDFVRSTAYSKLQPTDWIVVREMETGVIAPEETTLYRSSVRDASAAKISTIEEKQEIETLAAYLRSEEFASWPEPPGNPAN